MSRVGKAFAIVRLPRQLVSSSFRREYEGLLRLLSLRRGSAYVGGLWKRLES